MEPFAQAFSMISRKRKGNHVLFPKPLVEVLDEGQGTLIHLAEMPLVGRLINNLL